MSKSYLSAIGTIILMVYFLLPTKDKSNPMEIQIKSLAYSHGIYNHSVCPNKKNLALIKQEYLKQIPIHGVSDRVWISENFDRIFVKECEKYEGDLQ